MRNFLRSERVPQGCAMFIPFATTRSKTPSRAGPHRALAQFPAAVTLLGALQLRVATVVNWVESLGEPQRARQSWCRSSGLQMTIALNQYLPGIQAQGCGTS